MKGKVLYGVKGQYSTLHWADPKFLDPVTVFRFENKENLMKKHTKADPNKSKTKKVLTELRKKVPGEKVSKKTAPKKTAPKKTAPKKTTPRVTRSKSS